MTIRVLSVITKKFPLTKPYIGNYVGIWGAFSQGYMYIVLILIIFQSNIFVENCVVSITLSFFVKHEVLFSSFNT